MNIKKLEEFCKENKIIVEKIESKQITITVTDVKLRFKNAIFEADNVADNINMDKFTARIKLNLNIREKTKVQKLIERKSKIVKL